MVCMRVFFVNACMYSDKSVMRKALSALVGRCVRADALMDPCCLLCDETSAERFSDYLVALSLLETKEEPLLKLTFCQVGGEAVSGGTTSPPFDWFSHTPLGMNWHSTYFFFSGRTLLLNYFGLCSVRFKKTCHHFNGCFEQKETLTACGWSTVWKWDYTSSERHGRFMFSGSSGTALFDSYLIDHCGAE